MDPLSIAATIPSLLITCRNTLAALKYIRDQYKNAQKTIEWLCTQSVTIMTALSQIQDMCSDQESALARRCKAQPSILESLDKSLAICTAIYSSLYKRLTKIKRGSSVIFQPGFLIKLKVMWSEAEMKSYLDQMVGLSSSLSFLLQGVHM
jgi:hypothetical protein